MIGPSGRQAKSLEELIELSGSSDQSTPLLPNAGTNEGVRITRGSADTLDLVDSSVDCVVMDPPYYDNVMYAELSDFFYVWLKRTAGFFFPRSSQTS